jgi:hypothetical protein
MRQMKVSTAEFIENERTLADEALSGPVAIAKNGAAARLHEGSARN